MLTKQSLIKTIEAEQNQLLLMKYPTNKAEGLTTEAGLTAQQAELEAAQDCWLQSGYSTR